MIKIFNIFDNLVQLLIDTSKPDWLLTYNLLYEALQCGSTEPNTGQAIGNSIICTKIAYTALITTVNPHLQFIGHIPERKAIVLVHIEDGVVQDVYCNTADCQAVIVEIDDNADDEVVVSNYDCPEVISGPFHTIFENGSTYRSNLDDIAASELKLLNL